MLKTLLSQMMRLQYLSNKTQPGGVLRTCCEVFFLCLLHWTASLLSDSFVLLCSTGTINHKVKRET